MVPVLSLLLRPAMSEARTVSDPSGNAKSSKHTEGGCRVRAGGDTARAALLAVAEDARRMPAEPRQPPHARHTLVP